MTGGNYSNVHRFHQRYGDGQAYYVAGVGTVHRDQYGLGTIEPATYANGKFLDDIDGPSPLWATDMGGNYSGPARIERMMRYFQREIRRNRNSNQNNTVMDIDIVGFSRGAAQARHFANMLTDRANLSVDANRERPTDGLVVTRDASGREQYYYRYTFSENLESANRLFTVCQRVNFRFMGLFDTVISKNYSDLKKYNLRISPAFAHVAHATALNEHRSSNLVNFRLRNPQEFRMHYGGFPLVSIGKSGADADGHTRIEMGFIGAHADIGGGYRSSEDQLSLVALSWMTRQAELAGVTMRSPPTLPTGNVILHDQSHAIRVGNPNQDIPQGPNNLLNLSAEDRVVSGAVSGNTQRTMVFGNRSMRTRDTYNYINYANRNPRDEASFSRAPTALLRCRESQHRKRKIYSVARCD
jgi:hypothetical protein